MRVLYDFQAFLQVHGGVSRYFAELMAALSEIDGFEARVPVMFSDNEYLGQGLPFLTRRHFKGKERIMAAFNTLQASRTIRDSFDVFHPTYYRPYFLEALKRPFVITIHDMVHELFSPGYVRDDGTSRWKRVLCERSSRIIAVSANTKRDICDLLNVPEEKIVVVPHATRMRFAGGPRLHEKPYLLYVGSRSGYKNFPAFAEAAATVLPRFGLDLLCAGGGRLTREEKEILRSHGLMSRFRHFLSPRTPELASLYHFASGFCYPSLYEGFGLPILEAFACDCPVAASSVASIPEVAGQAAEYFEPRCAESIAAAIQRVIGCPSRACELRAAGRARLEAFSWRDSALKTYSVYREAA